MNKGLFLKHKYIICMFLDYIYNRHVELLLKGMGKTYPNISQATSNKHTLNVPTRGVQRPIGLIFVGNSYTSYFIETFLIDIKSYVNFYQI